MEQYYSQNTKPTETLWRGLYGIDYEGACWIVEVDYFDISETIKIFRDGIEVARGKSSMRYEIGPGTTIETAMALYGMKRVHVVDERSGNTTMLKPLPGTAESLRLRFEKKHPATSKIIAFIAWCTLFVALVTQIPNVLNSFSSLIDVLSLPVPRFEVPTLNLPDWLNGLLGFLGIVAGLDRGLRMKHNALLDY